MIRKKSARWPSDEKNHTNSLLYQNLKEGGYQWTTTHRVSCSCHWSLDSWQVGGGRETMQKPRKTVTRVCPRCDTEKKCFILSEYKHHYKVKCDTCHHIFFTTINLFFTKNWGGSVPDVTLSRTACGKCSDTDVDRLIFRDMTLKRCKCRLVWATCSICGGVLVRFDNGQYQCSLCTFSTE